MPKGFKMKNTQSTYAKKRSSGNMMYGPSKKVPKYPEYVSSYPPSNRYWWGELRDTVPNGCYVSVNQTRR